MEDPKVLDRMRADWNERASEDAYYYVAFGRREQGDEEFFATASDLVKGLVADFKRLPGRDAALEIGCGPGRLMRPLSRYFGEIHGVDVSDAMIGLARERLRDVPNAFPQHGSGSDLAMFPDGKFDFVYSYAVFQHIPSRDVVFSYLREAWRVLKPGGILRCQLNGLPPHAARYDTWSGVRITPDEVRAFARQQGFQLLALEEIWTQYMWITCRKRALPVIRNISNALTGEAVAPESGPMAALSLWIENFPADADLNGTTVTADGRECRLVYIGHPAADGITQVNLMLPEGIRTGLVAIEVSSGGTGWIRVIPPGPAVPRITNVTDGVNLLSANRVVSRTVKIAMRDVARPEEFHVFVDGRAIEGFESFCTDQTKQTYEFNFPLPEWVAPGAHQVTVGLGRREFAPVAIEVV
jgi:ubiquinone/menaquinone biosynthesis C-methylase UbiE